MSGEYEATIELATSRPVIGVISVDNYDDLENETSESDISQINSFVAILSRNLQDSIRCFHAALAWIAFTCLQIISFLNI